MKLRHVRFRHGGENRRRNRRRGMIHPRELSERKLPPQPGGDAGNQKPFRIQLNGLKFQKRNWVSQQKYVFLFWETWDWESNVIVEIKHWPGNNVAWLLCFQVPWTNSSISTVWKVPPAGGLHLTTWHPKHQNIKHLNIHVFRSKHVWHVFNDHMDNLLVTAQCLLLLMLFSFL